MFGPADHAGLEERAVNDQLTAAVEQVEQARLALGARRICIPSPRPPMAFADARPPARHERGSTPSPSRAVAGAQPPTPAVTRFWSDSFASFLLRFLALSFVFPLIWFVSFLLQNSSQRTGSVRRPGLMLRDPFGKTIRHKIQSDVMLEERFEAREHQGEPLRRVGHLFHKLVPVASEADLGDS